MGRGCKLFHRNPDRDPRKNITLNTFHRFLIPRRITARLIRVKKKLIRRKIHRCLDSREILSILWF